MAENKTLVLFTGEFPYGKKGEPFLNTEINYLAKEFKTIYVFPRNKSKILRALPNNVVVLNDLTGIKKQSLTLALIYSFFVAVIKEVNHFSILVKYIIKIKDFFYLYREAVSMKSILNNKVSELKLLPNKTLYYSYWFDNSLLALSLLKKDKQIQNIISRAHGFDLYDDRTKIGIVPFRNSKAEFCNSIFTISRNGLDYIKKKVLFKDKSKIETSYLGVEPPLFLEVDKWQEIPVFVSCARMEKFKRVPLIYEVLKEIDLPLQWVHFGDGEEYEMLRKKIQKEDSKLEVILKGQVPNDEIVKFYQSNFVDVFISASTSEGLPVSMMEAQSYGVPIIGFNVGGVNEIIKEEITGLSVDNVYDIEAFKTQIVKYLNREILFNREQIQKHYAKHFNASKNYDKFVKKIKQVLC